MTVLSELKWNVFIGDFNHKDINTYNIFNHGTFKDECDKAWKKYKRNRPKFEEEIKKILAYYFWSKCEWEVIIQHWPPSERYEDRKVDVYEQVMINWGIFINYVWNTYSERRKHQ